MITKRQRFVNVNVTIDNIFAGIRNSSKNCPISSALKSMGFHYVDVKNKKIRITDKESGFSYEWTCPIEPAMWLMKYDANGPDSVKPFRFQLDLRKATVKTIQSGPSGPKPPPKGKTMDTRQGFRPNEMVWW